MNALRHILSAVQWGFLGYFIVLNVFYVGLAIIAMFRLRRYMGGVAAAERVYTHLQMPVSLVVPAYNEEGSIVTSVRALLQLRYQHFEIIIVNDGSKDDTLGALIREFQLTPFPEAYRVQIRTQADPGIYRSLKYPNLRVVDKENGGKADATNAGLNAARHPIFYCGDADSVLEVAQPRARRAALPRGPAHGCLRRNGAHRQRLPGAGRRDRKGRPAEESARARAGGRIPARVPRRAPWLERDQRAPDRVRGVRRVPPRNGGRRGRLSRRRDRRGHGTRRAPAPASLGARPALPRFVHPGSGVLDRGAGGPGDARKTAQALAARACGEPVGEPQALFARGSGAAGWLAFPFFIVFELASPLVELGASP